MRVGPFEVSNPLAPALREPSASSRLFLLPDAPSGASLGGPSSSAFGLDDRSPLGRLGMTLNEHPDMWPRYRFLTFDEMARSDGCVKSNLQLYGLPVRQATWTLDPSDDVDPMAALIRDAANANFGVTDDEPGMLDLTWDEQIQQDLLCLKYGSMGEEIMWGDTIVWRDGDGDEHVLRPVIRLAPRFPGTVRIPDGFETDSVTGLLDSVLQDLPHAQKIPGEKLLWYTVEREGTDWYGVAMLRPMYGAWRLKKAVMIAAGIGWDRFAYGTPVARYPRGSGATAKREAQDLARNVRTGERGWVALEGAKTEGWDLEILGGNATIADPTNLIRIYNDEMSMSTLTHFMMLARTGTTGSRAVGDVQSAPYYMGLQSVAEMIAAQKMRRLFRTFVDVNFGAEYDVPILRVKNIQTTDQVQIATALLDLSQALPGVLTSAKERVADILDRFDLYAEDFQSSAEAVDAATVVAGAATGIPPAAVGAPVEGGSLGL